MIFKEGKVLFVGEVGRSLTDGGRIMPAGSGSVEAFEVKSLIFTLK